jgi:3-deoxy-D-manno-octulosonic-acid transferase
MFFLYNLLLVVGFLVFLPRFLFQKKYAASFRERLGNLPDFDAEGKPVVWLHCVSVGEAQAARPLVESLGENFPEYKLVVSTTTLTGQTLAKEIFKRDAALVFYFPFDFRFAVRRALRKIQPSVVLLMETEIWFNFLREAAASGARIAIVNGRLSEKSARRYGWIKQTVSRVLQNVELALMQAEADAERLINLGIEPAKVKITGNLKFDQTFDEAESELTKNFRARFDFSKNAPLIVAASTHAPEEKLILEAFKTVYKNSPEKPPRLLLVPRHPERFDEVADLIEQTGFEFVRRNETPASSDRDAEMILLDSIGELRAALPLAEIVFVGGSLIPHGGQNILEPAAARKAIVTGFYTTNFAAVVKEFLAKDALVQLPQLEENQVSAKLAETFAELLRDDARRENLAENASRVMRENRGAAAKTIERLKPIFKRETAK